MSAHRMCGITDAHLAHRFTTGRRGVSVITEFYADCPGVPHRPESLDDQRAPGESFCAECPDHEGCMSGYPCWLVKKVNQPTPARTSDDEETR